MPLEDHARDLGRLAGLAGSPHRVDDVLREALVSLKTLVDYDLAAVLELDGEELRVRAAEGPLADGRVRDHRIRLDAFPTVRRALATRRPIPLEEHHHASDEGDPYDGVLDLPHGHACMVVPLYAGDETLGVITLDRRACQTYGGPEVELAGAYGQIVALALHFAEQAALLDRYRHVARERVRQLEEDSGRGDAVAALEASGSPAMRALVRKARQVARSDLPVLITGETGTGKEVLARALHAWSPRAGEAFVTINAASVPESLVESELFGHVKGAFTGATARRPGRFLTANGGTLLLDEIGDMPLPAQAKLLRVLQEGTFQPVGSDTTVRVDVRVLAATHHDLEARVRQGAFREDLYYRLAVVPVEVPPLRERPEDAVAIAERHLASIARRRGGRPWILSDDARSALRTQPWKGNVRELVHTLERAAVLHPGGGRLEAGDLGLPETVHLSVPRPDVEASPDAPWPTLAENERRYLEALLERTQGRIYGAGGAAELAGMKPTTLQSRLRKLGVDRKRFAGG